MDLDPFEPVGIAAPTMRVLDAFLLHCLLSDSPPDSPAEIAALSRNQHLTASRGREPGLTLERDGREVRLLDWAAEILEGCGPIASALDAAQGGGTSYREALDSVRQRLTEPAALPSARVLRAIDDTPNRSYTRFVRLQAESSRARLLALPYPEELARRAAHEAEVSLAEQARIEAADGMPFEQFRLRYLDPANLVV